MAMKKPRDVTCALTHSPSRSPSPSLAHTHSLSLTHSLSHTLTLPLTHSLCLTHTQEKIMAMKKPRDVTCVDARNLIVEHLEVKTEHLTTF